MPYVDEGIDERLEVQLGTTDELKFFVKRDGAAVAPTALSAWVTILDPGGALKVARTQTGVTINGATVLFVQDWTGYELWEDYVADLEYSIAGRVYKERHFFDVVRCRLRCLVDESDVLEFYPDAEDHLQALKIADASRFIKRAWSEILNRIRAGKNRPSLILDTKRLIPVALHKSLEYMCLALFKELDDVWDKRRSIHEGKVKQAWADLGELKYDRTEDGLAGNNESKRINRRQWQV